MHMTLDEFKAKLAAVDTTWHEEDDSLIRDKDGWCPILCLALKNESFYQFVYGLTSDPLFQNHNVHAVGSYELGLSDQVVSVIIQAADSVFGVEKTDCELRKFFKSLVTEEITPPEPEPELELSCT